MSKRKRTIAAISAAIGVPPTSEAFDRRLNAAAKAGEQEAIRRETEAAIRREASEHRRALTMLAGCLDGINEAMLERHGFDAALLDALVAAGYLRFERRRYGARGNSRLDLTVRRFYITDAGREQKS